MFVFGTSSHPTISGLYWTISSRYEMLVFSFWVKVLLVIILLVGIWLLFFMGLQIINRIVMIVNDKKIYINLILFLVFFYIFLPFYSPFELLYL